MFMHTYRIRTLVMYTAYAMSVFSHSFICVRCTLRCVLCTHVCNVYDDDDDDIEFISTKIGSCRPLRSCGKKIIIK